MIVYTPNLKKLDIPPMHRLSMVSKSIGIGSP